MKRLLLVVGLMAGLLFPVSAGAYPANIDKYGAAAADSDMLSTAPGELTRAAANNWHLREIVRCQADGTTGADYHQKIVDRYVANVTVIPVLIWHKSNTGSLPADVDNNSEWRRINTAGEISAWADCAYDLAEQMEAVGDFLGKSQWNTIEVWNEPNCNDYIEDRAGSELDLYWSNYLTVAMAYARAVDSNINIVVGGLAFGDDNDCNSAEDWINAAQNDSSKILNGAQTWPNAWAVHPYGRSVVDGSGERTTPAGEQWVARARDESLAADNQTGRTILCTEMGYRVDTNIPDHDGQSHPPGYFAIGFNDEALEQTNEELTGCNSYTNWPSHGNTGFGLTSSALWGTPNGTGPASPLLPVWQAEDNNGGNVANLTP